MTKHLQHKPIQLMVLKMVNILFRVIINIDLGKDMNDYVLGFVLKDWKCIDIQR